MNWLTRLLEPRFGRVLYDSVGLLCAVDPENRLRMVDPRSRGRLAREYFRIQR